MCMLFVKKANLALPKDHFDSLWDHNPHGLAVWNTTEKALFKTLDEVEAEKYLADHVADELVVHFRLATSGAKTLDQLHGFDVAGGKWVLFHNGVLRTYSGKADQSDTQQLAELFYDKTPEEMVAYLEKFETSSRFLLIEKETGKILKPACAVWCAPKEIDGIELQFSNTYAIDRKLLPESERSFGSYYGTRNYSTYDDYDDLWGDVKYPKTKTNTSIQKFDWNTGFAQPKEITEAELKEWQLYAILQDVDKATLIEFIKDNATFMAEYILDGADAETASETDNETDSETTEDGELKV